MAERTPAAQTPALQSLLSIIQEDADLLVVNKPAGLVCHPTKTDERSSLIGRARLHLSATGERPHLVNRLDRETSGVVIIAKNATAAGELGLIWQGRSVRKTYWAIVHGLVREESFVIDAPLGKDDASAVAIKDKVRADGAGAQTEGRVLRRFQREGGPFSLVEVQPRTGRKHQIRIHLAHIAHPIVGDKLYGLDERFYLDFVMGKLSPEQSQQLILPFQALHGRSLEFEFRGEKRRFVAEAEPWFARFGVEPEVGV